MCSAVGGGLPKLLKYSTQAGVHTHTHTHTHTHSSILLHTTKTEFWLVPRIEPGARDTGDRSGAVGGVTPLSPGNPDIGQYVPRSAVRSYTRTAAVSRKLEDHWWARNIAAAGCPPFHHPSLAQLLARFSLHTRV